MVKETDPQVEIELQEEEPEQELDDNTLNKLDLQNDCADEGIPVQPTPQQTSCSESCELSIAGFEMKMSSSIINAYQLNSMILETFEKLNQPTKENERSYFR